MHSETSPGHRYLPRTARLFGGVLLVLLASATVLSGCDDATTDPVGEPIFLEGTLEGRGQFEHRFTFDDNYVVRFELLEIRFVDVENELLSEDDVSLLLRLGRTVEGVCERTGEFGFLQGTVHLINLTEREYCFTVVERGFLTADETLEYSFILERQGG